MHGYFRQFPPSLCLLQPIPYCIYQIVCTHKCLGNYIFYAVFGYQLLLGDEPTENNDPERNGKHLPSTSASPPSVNLTRTDSKLRLTNKLISTRC